ncbi:MAG: Mur ligase family protein, partial [bacterium]|nr:Mur ligase family protein [bacterium]
MLGRIKNNALFQRAYHLSGFDSAYHFLWAFLGAVRYGFPSRHIKVIGVTGTKGKSTTLEFVNAAFEGAGKKTALLSSIRVKVGEVTEKNMTGNTMPGRAYIEQFLDRAVRAGCEYAFVEVTSQGAVMHRHRFIRWAAALVTNIAPEHIEAHGSFENYRAAKLSFLRHAVRGGARVFLNQEDQGLEWFFQSLPAEKTSFYSKELIRDARSPVFDIFPGDFNRENIAGAVACARAMGIEEESIWKGLAMVKGIPGRLEFVMQKPFAVVLDYAHTP